MIAIIAYKRDQVTGNPYTELQLPNNESYRFSGLGMFGARAMLKQLGYEEKWRSWKPLHGYYPYDPEKYRMRIERIAYE